MKKMVGIFIVILKVVDTKQIYILKRFPMEQYPTHVATIKDGRDEMFYDSYKKKYSVYVPISFVKCFNFPD